MSIPRKLIHLAVTVVPAAGWLVSYPLAVALAGGCVLGSLAAELARRRWQWVNRTLWRLLPATFRPGEERRILGSTWLSVGMLATLLLFGRDAGGTAVLFMVWGDPMAELVGRTLGRAQQGKTWVGSLGCLVACLLAGGVGIGWGGLHLPAVLLGAVVATVVERWPPPPDDNLWMPLLSGLAVETVQRLTGGPIVLFTM